MTESAPDLDKFDRQILGRLQGDPRQPAERIATAIGLSVTAVQRRIRRLREAGVIRGERLVLDAAALGYGLAVWVEVELREASRKAVIDGFKRRMAAEPRVQQCFYVAGDSDFLLLIRCRDVAEFEALTRELFFDDANIRKFRSVFVLDECKDDAGLPLAD
ncbi:Lrp/AsnC family transcriptional regulator [Roseateles sp. P5_E11]